MVGTIVHVTESNELRLLTLHIWLVKSFVSRRVTVKFTRCCLLHCHVKIERVTEREERLK